MKKFLFLFTLLSIFSSCSKTKDCECTTTDDEKSSPVTIYDYDGSCNEMNEKNVSCKEI